MFALLIRDHISLWLQDVDLIMERDSSARVFLSFDDDIERLRLSIRPLNALKRANIRTIGELALVIETGHLRQVRNIGQKLRDEIEASLSHARIAESREPLGESGVPLQYENGTQQKAPVGRTPGDSAISLAEVIRCQAELVEKQISVGLLHGHARILDNSIMNWLSLADIIDRRQAHVTLASVLGASVNMCDELSFLIHQIPYKHLKVLTSRYGLESKTLEQVGAEIGVTRERARQIGVKLKRRIGTSGQPL